MEELIRLVNKVLADTFVMYLKVHNFHWNVEDPDFYSYHKFLEDLYSELYSAIDPIAEHVRSINGYAVGSLAQYIQLTSIKEFVVLPKPMAGFRELYSDNTAVINSLMEAFNMAEKFNEHGLANFLQDRMDAHKKHGWMLRATFIKGDEE